MKSFTDCLYYFPGRNGPSGDTWHHGKLCADWTVGIGPSVVSKHHRHTDNSIHCGVRGV